MEQRTLGVSDIEPDTVGGRIPVSIGVLRPPLAMEAFRQPGVLLSPPALTPKLRALGQFCGLAFIPGKNGYFPEKVLDSSGRAP